MAANRHPHMAANRRRRGFRQNRIKASLSVFQRCEVKVLGFGVKARPRPQRMALRWLNVPLALVGANGKACGEKKDYNLLACSWEDIFYFPNLLLEEGYEFRELPCENFTYELLKGDRRVTLYTREIPKGDIQGMVQAIDEVNEYSKGEDLYIVSALENQDYLLNKLSVSGKVRKQMDRLYKVN